MLSPSGNSNSKQRDSSSYGSSCSPSRPSRPSRPHWMSQMSQMSQEFDVTSSIASSGGALRHDAWCILLNSRVRPGNGCSHIAVPSKPSMAKTGIISGDHTQWQLKLQVIVGLVSRRHQYQAGTRNIQTMQKASLVSFITENWMPFEAGNVGRQRQGRCFPRLIHLRTTGVLDKCDVQ